ncbi:hypothetical protein Bca4012_066588 [Brassica carinata]
MAAASNTAAIFASPLQSLSSNKSSLLYSSTISPLQRRFPTRKLDLQVKAAATTLAPLEEIKEYKLPSWAMFEMGRAPVYWKTMNGLPPTAGEKLKLFYNPAATELTPNEDYGVAFNAVNLIFSFTNGVDWDGPYRLQFQVPKRWQNKPIEFFNEGLANELSQDGACERAIFPDSDIVATRCTMIANLTVEGGDRCNLDLVPGCMDTNSEHFNPLANVDDGSCPLELSDSDE